MDASVVGDEFAEAMRGLNPLKQVKSFGPRYCDDEVEATRLS